jgi:hypothetical protein
MEGVDAGAMDDFHAHVHAENGLIELTRRVLDSEVGCFGKLEDGVPAIDLDCEFKGLVGGNRLSVYLDAQFLSESRSTPQPA